MARFICFAFVLGCAGIADAADEIMPLEIGKVAPTWSGLEGVDGKKHDITEFANTKLLAVVFFSNHCPDCNDYLSRLEQLQNDFSNRGLQVVLINSGGLDGESLDKMVPWSKKKKVRLPFLRDSDQTVGNSYGATKTPEVFLFDSKRELIYRGAIDDHWDPEQVMRAHLRIAVEESLAGKPVSEPVNTIEFGCDIDY